MKFPFHFRDIDISSARHILLIFPTVTHLKFPSERSLLALISLPLQSPILPVQVPLKYPFTTNISVALIRSIPKVQLASLNHRKVTQKFSIWTALTERKTCGISRSVEKQALLLY